MQIYGIRFHYFMRFGEKNNSVVFDLSPEQKRQLQAKETTLDAIYDQLKADPVSFIASIKKRGLTNLIGIMGATDGDPDKSNGAGKSSTMEGIAFVNYDRIVRRNVNTDKTDRAGLSVVTRLNGRYPSSMKESFVEQIFEEGGRIYRIRRGRTFSKNHASNSPVLEFECYNGSIVDALGSHRTGDTNDAIASLLPMDFDLFINSVMFAQNDAGKFLIGTDKTRKEMISSLLRIEEIVANCLEVIRTRKNLKDKELNALRVKIGVIETRIQQMQTIEAYQSWIKQKQTELATVSTIIAGFDAEIEKLSKSDKFQLVKSIRAEGVKVKEQLTPKREQMAVDIKPWQRAVETTDASIATQDQNTTSLVEKISKLEQTKTSLQKSIGEFDRKTHTESTAKVEKYKKALPQCQQIVGELNKLLMGLVAKRTQLATMVDLVKTDKDILAGQLATIKGDAFVCSFCKSNVSRAHIEKEVADADEKLKKYNAELQPIQAQEVENQKKLDEAGRRVNVCNEWILKESTLQSDLREHNTRQTRVSEIQIDIHDIEKQKKDVVAVIESLRKQRAEHVSQIETIKKAREDEILTLQKQLDELAKKLIQAQADEKVVRDAIEAVKVRKQAEVQRKSGIETSIGAMQKDIETLQIETKALAELQDTLKAENKVLNRLLILEDVFGLDGIQTRIVQKYLPMLNMYIKEFMDILSNSEMLVKLVVNDKSKIDIVIEGGTADTFSMLSGGEKMIVRLAVDIGLALLSFTRCAQKPEIICLDEIFGPLDNSRTELVFKVLHQLKVRFKRVLVISHKTEIKDLIQTNILIEKSAGMQGMSEIVGVT